MHFTRGLKNENWNLYTEKFSFPPQKIIITHLFLFFYSYMRLLNIQAPIFSLWTSREVHWKLMGPKNLKKFESRLCHKNWKCYRSWKNNNFIFQFVFQNLFLKYEVVVFSTSVALPIFVVETIYGADQIFLHL